MPATEAPRPAVNIFEWVLPLAAVGLVFVMLVPMPSFLLDLLLAASITASLLVLLSALHILRPAQFSVFPSLLLLLTLFRLSLNLASSRRILLHGNEGAAAAGKVIQAFGQFVVGGNYVVGFVLFLALIAIQYSTAQQDHRKVGQLAAAIKIAFQEFGGLPPTPEILEQAQQTALSLPAPPPSLQNQETEDRGLSDLQKELEDVLAEQITRGEVALRNSPDGLVISLREAGFFDSGSAGVKAASEPAFERMASLLRDQKRRIRVEGYTDNIPIHNSQFASNWELSTARATEMIRLLITRYDFPPESLSAGGYGEYHPIASNQAESGRAQNRRVDVVILRRQTAFPPARGFHPAPKPASPKPE